MIPPGRVALYLERRLAKGLVSIHPRPLAVGPVGGLGAEIASGPPRAVAVIAAEGPHRCIHGGVVAVDAEDRKSGVKAQRVSARVDLHCRRNHKQKKTKS